MSLCPRKASDSTVRTGATPQSRASGLFVILAISAMLTGLYLRTSQLGRLEPFVDETANILTSIDGKTRAVIGPVEQGRPLLAYMFRMAQVFPSSPVVAARASTVTAAMLTIGAIGATLYVVSGPLAALVGMWLWAVFPFAVFHDRLALQDPFVTAYLAIALLLVAVGSHVERKQGRDLLCCFAAGVMFGLAFLTKISALEALPWMGVVYLALQLRSRRRVFDLRLVGIAIGALLPVACLGSAVFRLGSALRNDNGTGLNFIFPQFRALFRVGPPLATDQSFLHSVRSLFSMVANRMMVFGGWYWGYQGWTLLAAWFLAFVCLLRGRTRAWAVLALAWPVAFLCSSVLYNSPFARYSHPDRLPLILFIGASIGGWMRERSPKTSARVSVACVVIAVAGIILASARGSLQIVRDVRHAPVPAGEVYQYVTGQWSGNGLAVVYGYLDAYARNNNTTCIVVTPAYWRVTCYGLLLAARNNPRIRVIPHTVQHSEDMDGIRNEGANASVDPRSHIFLVFEPDLEPAPPWVGRPGNEIHLMLNLLREDGRSRFEIYSYDPTQ
jgi:hypothetical protein